MEARTETRNMLSSVATTLSANATVFAASACVMLVELVAGRIISQYLGMSLYTWTSIIGVIMAGISLGNWLGGRMADRRAATPLLAVLFLLSAAGCVAILPLNSLFGTLEPLRALPWTARIFAHVTLVFLGPAFLLGMVNPVVAKLALDLQAKAGRAVGGVFAWGAAGSILGTFATGFWLVPSFPASRILVVAAGGLALLGVVFAVAAVLRCGMVPPVRVVEDRGERPSVRAWRAAVATVLVSNAAFMGYELALSRIVSREFGSSLYTWTTVIGVVLAGICLGNWLGGRLADRKAGPGAIAGAFALASLTMLCSPWLSLCMGVLRTDLYTLALMSWPMQILIHCLAAFGVPCIFIGMISPLVIRRLLDRGFAPGRTVGTIYAWGAVGGIVGTFAAGYLLVAWLGSVPLVACVALALACTALCWRPGWWSTASAAVTAGAFVVALLPANLSGAFALNTGLRTPSPDTTVYETESQYSYIAVTADPEDDNVREMYLDKLVHSQVDLRDPSKLLYEYEWVYSAAMLKRFPASAPVRALVIGGGGYAYPNYLEVTRPGSQILVSEIDPAVTEAAHAAFGLPRGTSIEVHDIDARNLVTDLVRGNSPKFDCIFGDSINDYTVPYHLTTLEFTRMVDTLLQDDGLYMLNMIDMYDSGAFLAAVLNTCRTVFPHVAVFNTGRLPFVRDTFIVVCSKRPLVLQDLPMRLHTQYQYAGMLLPEEAVASLLKRHAGSVLTDDYAPVENMLAPVVRGRSGDPGELNLRFARIRAGKGDNLRAVRYACRALAIHPKWPDAVTFLVELATGPAGAAEVRKDVALEGQAGVLPQNVMTELLNAIEAALKQQH